MTATVPHTESAATRSVDGVEVPIAGTYAIDASHTDVSFVVRHLMLSKTRGRFPTVEGTIVIGEDPLDSRVEVSIETAGVETGDDHRDQHLRSPDFFDADQHPRMTYRSRAVRPTGPGRWIVDGDLTIRDVTRPVELDLSFEGGLTDPWGNVRAGFTASAEINRDEFGLTWNQLLEGGGVLVGRTVSIEIEAELVRAA
jgi:polyisoprenoid-binding protein YceI